MTITREKIWSISTHTLARRVTVCCASRRPDSQNFNPHPRTEGDNDGGQAARHHPDFNPHPRTEGDRIGDINALGVDVISTHTLARRVTPKRAAAPRRCGFQPTPSHGG